MRKRILAGILLLFGHSMAYAEILSVEPWLSKETVATDVSLAGDWELYGLCVQFVPQVGAGHTYDVLVNDCDGGDQMAFIVSLHRVDERLLLHIGPAAGDDLPLLLPVYWLQKAVLDDDTMTLFDIDEKSFDWRAASANIEHKDDLVLSPTEDLKSFVSWQVGDFSFFEGEPEFTLTRTESDD